MWHVIVTVEYRIAGGFKRSTYAGVIGSDEEKISSQSQLFDLAVQCAADKVGRCADDLAVLYYSIEFEDISRYGQIA